MLWLNMILLRLSLSHFFYNSVSDLLKGVKMTFREYAELIESKQVGIIYHFNTEVNFKKMIRNELNLVSFNGCISCTRNALLPMTPIGDISIKYGYTVRLNIDENKLFHKYKIKPVRDSIDNSNILDQGKIKKSPLKL